MSFGDLSPDPVETADGFMVGGAIMAPPPCGIGLIRSNESYRSIKINFIHQI